MQLVTPNGQPRWLAEPDDWAAVKNQRAVRNVTQPIRFQGQWHDEESGLYYNRHRYYDPQQGRYISQDPIGLKGGTNLYGYVTNPTGMVDPLGLEGVGTCGQEDAYDSANGYFHYYQMENEICSLSTEGCSANAVWSALKKNPAPGWDSSMEVQTGDETRIRFMGMSGGDVSHVVDEANMTLYNITHPNHFFADGYVSRSVDVKNGSVFVRSTGEGITSPGVRWAGPFPATRAMRATLNMKLYKPGFDSLDENIRNEVSQ